MDPPSSAPAAVTPRARPRGWRKGLLVAGLALGLQGAILGLAVLIGVLDPQPPQEARLKLPAGSVTAHREQQQALDNQIAQLNRLQNEGMARLMEPLLEATRPELAVARPDLVQAFQSMGAMLPAASFFPTAAGALTDGLDTDRLPLPEPVSFLGETLNARRIVLLLDVSGSVKTKMQRAGLSMEQVRAEVHRFVDQLGPNHLFGIIQFTRNWQAFRPDLVPATEAMRQQVRDWIGRSFRTTGTSGPGWSTGSPNGIQAVLAAAFAMDPQIDEIFIVSDGDFYRTPPGGGGQGVPWPELRADTRRLQQQSIGQTRLRLLCFHPPAAARADLAAWARENGDGTLRVVDSASPAP